MRPVLSAEEARVLGCLLEKQYTTPEYYPLSLNALMLACNQKTNRDPVVDYDESTVLGAVRSLDARHYAKALRLHDSRVDKYKETYSQALSLLLPQSSIMCVLLLRGPQTVGELRVRTERIYAFSSNTELEQALERLQRTDPWPLVALLPRQPGQKEARYAHLLCGEPVLNPIAEDTEHTSKETKETVLDRLDRLERLVAVLRAELDELKS